MAAEAKRAALAALALSACLFCAKREKGAAVREEPLPAVAEEAAPRAYVEKPIEKCDVLLSGFEPFGGRTFNSSWEAIGPLDGETVGGKKVRAVLLPVVWGEAPKKLAGAINVAQPEVVIGFGMGTRVVRLELAAWNERREGKDNLGNPPPSKVIEEGGPEELHATLPVNDIAAALTRLKVKFVLSTDAGGYLCNEAFYALMRRKVECAGFVHVPVARPGTLEMEKLKRAARAIVEACIESAAD